MSLIGYCTNVHAGVGLASTLAQLDEFAVDVRRRLDREQPLGLGLWLSAATVQELAASEHQRRDLADWFAERRLVPYTMNAFPYGDFHQQVVKHRVYDPPWWDPRRGRYTLDVARTFDTLLPQHQPGTISTLPLGWPHDGVREEHVLEAARQLGQVAVALRDLEEQRGRHLRVCLEPEPGCLLQSAADVVTFFDTHLREQLPRELVDRYLGVCHDVCHSAVMFEPQQAAWARYCDAEISVGKIQISSAIAARCDPSPAATQNAVAEELSAFAEDRYLHQTVVQSGTERRFYEDLPMALAAERDQPAVGSEWRVHFHVPIFLERCGQLYTTQGEISQCLAALRASTKTESPPALEVETYAWSVLPVDLRQELAAGIAAEIEWLRGQLQATGD